MPIGSSMDVIAAIPTTLMTKGPFVNPLFPDNYR